MSKISLQSLAQALYEETKNTSEKEGRELARKSIRILAKNRMLGKFEEFVRMYKEIENKNTDTLDATITSAHALTDKEVTALKKEIKEKYKVKHVTLDEREDKTLIGGFRLQIGDSIFDQSARGKLTQLQKALTTNYHD